MNKIYFVTKNKHKFEEAKLALKGIDIEIEQIAEEKIEQKELSLKDVAIFNANLFFEKYKKPILIDDTGVFFKAYNNFPGTNPKLIFDSIGYKGLLKLLENENREAEFLTILAYKDKDHLKIFEGKLKCVVDIKVNDLDKDVMPYERIFLVNGKPLSSLSREEKNLISHRAIAFKKFKEWYLSKNK